MTIYAKSPRILLRDFERTDAPALQSVYGDEEVTKFLSFPARDLAKVQKLVDGIVERQLASPRSEYAFAVIRRATDEFIGMVRLGVNPDNSAAIGFAIKQAQWGHGYGIEATQMAMAFGFDELGLASIAGARDPQNEVSAAVMAKLGMQYQRQVNVSVELASGERYDRDSVEDGIDVHRWNALHLNRALKTSPAPIQCIDM